MQPGQFNPRGEDWMVRKLQELERSVQQLAAANPYAAMGIAPAPGGINITGNLAVSGTLSLPNGIINNDALNSPVMPAAQGNSASNFAVPQVATASAMVNVCSKTIFAPSDAYTRALVTINASVSAKNTGTASDYLNMNIYVGNTNAYTQLAAIAQPGNVGTVSKGASLLVEQLTPTGGASVEIRVGASVAAWAADAGNTAQLFLTVLYLR